MWRLASRLVGEGLGLALVGISVGFVGHSTVALRTPDFGILTDPLLRSTVAFLRRTTPPPTPRQLPRPDVVLLSHLHHDHTDLPSLRMLGASRLIVAPPGGADFLSDRGFGNVREAVVGEALALAAGVTVLPVPAVHDGGRTPRGPRATAVGYQIELAGRRIYFAGDTDIFPEMAELAPVDVALLPVWGWGPNLGPGHMDPVRAAEAAGLLRARIAVPIHWGTYFPAGMKSVLPGAGNLLTDPPCQFQRLCEDRAADTQVVVLAPGESLELSS